MRSRKNSSENSPRTSYREHKTNDFGRRKVKGADRNHSSPLLSVGKVWGLDITASVRQICRVLWKFVANGYGTKELVSKNQRVEDMRITEYDNPKNSEQTLENEIVRGTSKAPS